MPRPVPLEELEIHPDFTMLAHAGASAHDKPGVIQIRQ
jgi:hypothetical protein